MEEPEIPLTLEELRSEMESKGWAYSETIHNDKKYIRFEIGEHPNWSYTPLFSLYYTEVFEAPELRLKKGLSQWALTSINYPPLPSEVIHIFKMCSQHA